MKKIGMLKAMNLGKKYQKMSERERDEERKKRLHQMVDYARENSPYYQKLYKALPDEYKLSDIPPVNKQELMKHWNEWVCDRDIKLEDVNVFMQDLDNIGRKLKSKYIVFTTSGSTGNPLVALCDDTTNNVMSAVNIQRTFARKQDMKNFILHGGKTIGIFANGGFYLGNSSVRARLLTMPWKKKQMAVTSALLPAEQIVEELNQFQPTMLGGYPSNLELLIDEVKSGRLHIHPVLIMTGGEYLSETLRENLSKTFKCYVQTSYSCTEGGTIGYECTKHHFHINDDWVIVEPVDNENRPVEDGKRADKILLTNLFNFSQPFIRYEVTDRVVMHHDPCECGNCSPWLTLEGRNDDVITFEQNGENIRLAPLAIYAVLKEVHCLKRFQFIAETKTSAALRIEPVSGIDKEEAFSQACEALSSHFSEHGVHNINIRLDDESPKQQAGSGKFKHIIQA